MVVCKCDFCGKEGAREILLPQRDSLIVKGGYQDKILRQFSRKGIEYQGFDLCDNCLNDLLDAIDFLKRKNNKI